MIVQIILAAGAGSRAGGAKGSLVVAGKPLLVRLLDAAAASRVDRTVVVVGAEADRTAPLCARPNVVVAHNDDYKRGQTSSLQAALRALPSETEAFLIHPVDHALADAAVLDALVAAWRAADPATRPRLIARPTFGGSWGHPVLYSAAYAPAFLALSPDVSARYVYRAHLADVVAVPVADDACLLDLDTPADLALFESRFQRRDRA